MNLSGYDARGAIKYGYGSTGYLMGLTTIVDPSYISGIINISLTASQTSQLPVSKCVYDIEVFGQNDYTFKVIRGYADVYPEVSNGGTPPTGFPENNSLQIQIDMLSGALYQLQQAAVQQIGP